MNPLGIGLPPVPDATTGQPRPPLAPVIGWLRGAEPDLSDQRKKPSPPDHQGPLLEWYKPGSKGLLFASIATPLILFGLGTLRFGSLDWIQARFWWIWIFIVWPVPLGIWNEKTTILAVGARWLKYRRRWVNVYDLATVEIRPVGLQHHLRLIDSTERGLNIPIHNIQANPRLWALVYNGILHSAHNKEIKTNYLARKELYLPPNDPPTPDQRGVATERPLPRKRRAPSRWRRWRERRKEIKRNRPTII